MNLTSFLWENPWKKYPKGIPKGFSEKNLEEIHKGILKKFFGEIDVWFSREIPATMAKRTSPWIPGRFVQETFTEFLKDSMEAFVKNPQKITLSSLWRNLWNI